MEAIVEYDLKIRDTCANNKLFYTINPLDVNNNGNNYVTYDPNIDVTLIDPKLIYDMYYPPCAEGQNKNKNPLTPCIPFPPPPEPCKSSVNQKLAKLGLNIKRKPCVNVTPDGICIDGLKPDGLKAVMRNSANNSYKNQLNFANLRTLRDIEGDKQLLTHYHKWLLFNAKCNSGSVLK